MRQAQGGSFERGRERKRHLNKRGEDRAENIAGYSLEFDFVSVDDLTELGDRRGGDASSPAFSVVTILWAFAPTLRGSSAMKTTACVSRR